MVSAVKLNEENIKLHRNVLFIKYMVYLNVFITYNYYNLHFENANYIRCYII